MSTYFADTCRLVIPKLMKEFDWEDFHAAGCMGNLGHESGGLLELREIGAPEGRGGYGWAQWTGPRAKSFLAYCASHHYLYTIPEANFNFLCLELRTHYHHVVSSVAKTKTVSQATVAFERGYEAAGLISMHDRYKWAEIALDAFRSSISHKDIIS